MTLDMTLDSGDDMTLDMTLDGGDDESAKTSLELGSTGTFCQDVRLT